MSAVSMKLMPASKAASMTLRLSASCVDTPAMKPSGCSPKVMAPRHRRDTFRPEPPNRTLCMQHLDEDASATPRNHFHANRSLLYGGSGGHGPRHGSADA